MRDASALHWESCFDELRYAEACEERFAFYVTTSQTPDAPALLLLHGAGCTALSFAAIAGILRGHIAVIALDLRGHGATTAEGEMDMSTLCEDVCEAVRALYAPQPVPPLIVGGHSMGGALAARIAASQELPVAATILIDVVEGTALDALPHMAAWLATRPPSFQSREHAVRYTLRRGFVRNVRSARLSVPSQLRSVDGRWAWRTDLASTQPFWTEWFQGLTANFLSATGPKLLILAGVDRLDKALTIAQMQGKFQNIFIPEAGHAIHEDQPEKTATVILDFLRRNLLIHSEDDDAFLPLFQQRTPVNIVNASNSMEEPL